MLGGWEAGKDYPGGREGVRQSCCGGSVGVVVRVDVDGEFSLADDCSACILSKVNYSVSK